MKPLEEFRSISLLPSNVHSVFLGIDPNGFDDDEEGGGCKGL